MSAQQPSTGDLQLPGDLKIMLVDTGTRLKGMRQAVKMEHDKRGTNRKQIDLDSADPGFANGGQDRAPKAPSGRAPQARVSRSRRRRGG